MSIPLRRRSVSLTNMPSRRDVLRGLAGAGLGLGIARWQATTGAKKKRKNKKKERKSEAQRLWLPLMWTRGASLPSNAAPASARARRPIANVLPTTLAAVQLSMTASTRWSSAVGRAGSVSERRGRPAFVAWKDNVVPAHVTRTAIPPMVPAPPVWWPMIASRLAESTLSVSHPLPEPAM